MGGDCDQDILYEKNPISMNKNFKTTIDKYKGDSPSTERTMHSF